MPSRIPATDRPRPVPKSRVLRHVVGVVSLGALVLAPVFKALATFVGRALAAALRYL